MSERRRIVEHTVRIDLDTALITYCTTCMRILAELPTAHAEDYIFSEERAREHWNAYSRGHQVHITDIKGKRDEFIWETNKFEDMTDHD